MEFKTKTTSSPVKNMETEMNMENKSLMRTVGKSMQVKSLKDLVRARTTENPVLLIDVSFSMTAYMGNGKTRIDGLRQVVATMQSKRPTQMIAFGMKENPTLEPMPGGFVDPRPGAKEVAHVTEVPDATGSTPLAEAIDYARASGYGKAVVISDGGPNDPRAAMEAARAFGGQIDVVFVGNPGEPGSIFLEEMAKATGGVRLEGDLSNVKEIAGAVVGLLNGEVFEEEEDDDDEDDDEEDDEDEDEDDDDTV